MRIFGFYRAGEEGIDLSMLPFLPEPDRTVLFGGNLLVLRRVMGMVFGFSGFALVYGEVEEAGGKVVIDVGGPLFVSEGGYFSDDPAALVAMGLPLDVAACRRFLEEGDYEGFAPVGGTRRYGGRAVLRLSKGGMEISVEGEGRLNLGDVRKPDKFSFLPEVLGPFWKLKMMALPPPKRRRAYVLERWASGFAGLK